MRRVCILSILCTMATFSNVARAEKELSSPEELQETATHIVVGKVLAVYARTEKAGDWEYTRRVAEVQVQKVEKGEGVKEKDLIYARYYNRKWIGKGRLPPSDLGHWPHPKAGESWRVYVAKNAYDGYMFENNDGGFNVLGVNGFEELEREK